MGLFIDEKADEGQRQALQTIFGGQVGGWPAIFATKIGEFRGIEFVPIEFEIADDLAFWRAEIPGRVVGRANALSGPTTPAGKRVQTIKSSGLRSRSRADRNVGSLSRIAHRRIRFQLDGRKLVQQTHPVRLDRFRSHLAKCHKRSSLHRQKLNSLHCRAHTGIRLGVTTPIDTKASADPSAAGMPVIAYPGHAIAPPGELVAIGLPLHPVRPSLAELTARDPPFATVGCAFSARKSRGHRTHTGGHAATFGIADGKIEPGNSKIDGLAAHRLAKLGT
jgi:Protein of unknown function (DUF1326)